MTEKNKEKLEEEIAKLDQEINRSKNYQKALEKEREVINIVYEWKAPERVFENKSRSWYVSVAVIATVVIIFSALINNFILIIAIIALLVLMYALNSIPPQIVTHQITNKGLNIFDELIIWKNIKLFWITQRGEHTLINLSIQGPKDELPYKSILLKGDADVDLIVNYLVQYVDYAGAKEIPLNFITKILDGEYKPLVEFYLRKDIQTKDPKDNPYLPKNQAPKPKTQSS